MKTLFSVLIISFFLIPLVSVAMGDTTGNNSKPDQSNIPLSNVALPKPVVRHRILPANPNLILQGGDTVESATVIDAIPYNNSGTMIDEKVLAYRGPGVNIDSGLGVGILRHDPGKQGHALAIKLMGDPVHHYRS